MRHIGGMWSRRLLVVVVLSGSLAGIASHAVAQTAAPAFESGSGRAEAKYLRVGPSRGALPLTPQLGLALADHLASRGRGDVRTLDLGALADFLPAELVGAFPSLKVESTQDGAEEGQTVSIGTPAELPAGIGQLHARATDEPFGESSFRAAPVDLAGVAVQDGSSYASSGMVDGAAREAVARTRIGRVALGGGAVVLEGLEWEAVHRTGANARQEAAFRIGAVVVQGQRFTLPEGSDQPLHDAIAAAQPVLGPLGIQIQLPSPRVEGDVAEILPLRIRVADSELGRVIGPGVEAIQPGRDAVVDAVRGATEEADVALLLADVAVGVVAGGSSLDVELGGASARTAEPAARFAFSSFDLSGGATGIGPLPAGRGAGAVGTAPATGRLGATGSPIGAGQAGTAPAAGGGSSDRAPVELAGGPTRGDGGAGPLLPIGLATALTAAGAAALDHRRLRRIPLAA